MAQAPAHDPARRLSLVLASIIAVFGLLLAQSANLQVRQGRNMIELGEKQRRHRSLILAERGDLVDRSGVPLAMSVRSFRLVADPRQVIDLSKTSLALSQALNVDRGALRDRLARDSRYVILARGIDEALQRRVERLDLPGVYFEDEPQRVYPAGDLARSVLGRVSRVEGKGLSGLEMMFDRQLEGTPGLRLVERRPGGRSIPSGTNRNIPAKHGTTYVLTLDRALQYSVEGMLARQIAETGAKGGIVAVTDPRNGDVLALANMTVDDEGFVVNTAHNAALVNVYEPGSVNKLITISAALEKGVIGPESTLTVPDTLQVADHKFKDDEPHATMQWTPREILATSSNIGTIKIAKALGRKSLESYLRAFGLGSKTQIEFPGESAGLLVAKDHWSPTSIGSVPIGQGIAVTALQMLQAYNTVAVGGRRVPVRLVRGMVDSVGRQSEVPVRDVERVVSKKTAAIVTDMLTEVVRSGTGKAAALPGYAVAGKTGTAMKPLQNAKGYEKGAYVASFIGFFPAERPRLSAIVVLDEPRSSIYGGVVAAPLFAEIARFASQHYRIAPSEGNEVDLSQPRRDTGTQGGLKTRELVAVESGARVDQASAAGVGAGVDTSGRPADAVPSVAAQPASVGVPDVSRPRGSQSPTTAVTTPVATVAPTTTAQTSAQSSNQSSNQASAATPSGSTEIPDVSGRSATAPERRVRAVWEAPTTTKPATRSAQRTTPRAASNAAMVPVTTSPTNGRVVAARPPATVVAG